MRQYHIQCDEGEVGGYVLMPGDPARCELIANHFDGAEKVAASRQFVTYTGTLDGEKVSVTSAGIGCPANTICMEELCNIGAHTVIRVGTCGWIQDEGVQFGDFLISIAAVRADGTSKDYAPIEFPAVANLDVVDAYRDTCTRLRRRAHTGIVLSNDGFYPEMESHRMPNEAYLKERWEAWKRCGVIGVEMEASALFVAAAVRKIRAGAFCLFVDGAGKNEMPDPKRIPVEDLVTVGVEGLRQLIANDRAKVAEGEANQNAGKVAVS